MSNQSRAGTAVRNKGKRRVEEILDAATTVLIREGYSNFSLRRISDLAEMRLSNLQYYFPTKEELLTALLKRSFDAYSNALADISKDRSARPERRFMLMIDYLLKDQQDQESCLIFWELWALAARDKGVAQIMDDYYDVYLHQVVVAIRDISPEMPKAKAQKHAGAIVALIEGASLLRGFGKRQRSSLAGFERTLRDICTSLAQGTDLSV